MKSYWPKAAGMPSYSTSRLWGIDKKEIRNIVKDLYASFTVSHVFVSFTAGATKKTQRSQMLHF